MDHTVEGQPLKDALMARAEPALVDHVRRCEERHTPFELREFYRLHSGRIRLTEPDEGSAPRHTGWVGGPPDYGRLIEAWRRLEADFRRLLTSGVVVTGVQTRPQPLSGRQTIEAAWAADGDLDLEGNAIGVAGARFADVRISDIAPHRGVVEAPRASEMPLITSENVRELGDDEVLILLEDHARRVVERDGPMMAPGKISLMPIVKGKMVHRAEHGQLLEKLSYEAEWLAEWIASKVVLHQVPTAATIRKVLASDYAMLKARSTAAIQSAKD